MAGVNKAIILGRLGGDPEIKYMQNGDTVANLSLATSEKWTDKKTGELRENTEWHRIVAFRQTAEIIQKYCRKGQNLFIEGKIKTRKWTDNNGIERYTTEIIADQICLLGDNRSQNEYSTGSDYHGNRDGSKRQPQKADYGQDDFEDSMIPF